MSLSFLATTTPLTNSIFHQRSSEAPAVNLTRRRSSYTLCSGKQYDGDAVNDEGKGIDRRNVLVGLGGMYGATATFGNMAVAKPVQPPDLTQCRLANDVHLKDPVRCCPPYAVKGQINTIKDFVLPDKSEPMRIRKSVQELNYEELRLFNEAIRKMKELPSDDPRNFMQQAQIHCAYCNDAFAQVDFPNVNLQIHGSWLFLPWHRYYLYFWERILGKLVGKADFAIPYWDWDSKTGMNMPFIYKETRDSINYLFNPNRNPEHIDALLDYKYTNPNQSPSKSPCDPEPEPDNLPLYYDVKLDNQKQLYDMIVSAKGKPELFLGRPLSEGQVRESPGTLELLHNMHHEWVGTVDAPFWDMGNFHTAARDTIFYGHHANVDRMWSIYREQARSASGKNPDFQSPDWLNASFIFSDENNQLVRCKVSDSSESLQLNYKYSNTDPEWLRVRQAYKDYRKKASPRKASQKNASLVKEFGTESRMLYRTIRALVKRPKASLTEDQKKDATEAIVIERIELQDSGRQARFDVYISKPEDDGLVPWYLGEYVGGYVYIPHSTSQLSHQADLIIGITGIVEDIGADESEELIVSIVPRSGLFSIPGVSIQLLPHEDY